MKTPSNPFLCSIIFLAFINFAFAQNPARELSSLIDMRASSLDNAMSDKGYSFIKTEKSDTDSYTYWWNRNRNKCVTVRTNNGRVRSIVNTPNSDCNKNNSSSSNDFSSLINMRATYLDKEMQDRGYSFARNKQSASNSYVYWYNRRQSKCVVSLTSNGRVQSINNARTSECQRSNGNDSDYGNNLRNDSQKQAYMRGYDDGRARRTQQTGKYSSQVQMGAYDRGYSDGRSGKPKDRYYVNMKDDNQSGGGNRLARWRDLKGQRALTAYNKLENRGFDQVKSHKSNGRTYRIWTNRKTGQCLKTLSQNQNISEIAESDGCN